MALTLEEFLKKSDLSRDPINNQNGWCSIGGRDYPIDNVGITFFALENALSRTFEGKCAGKLKKERTTSLKDFVDNVVDALLVHGSILESMRTEFLENCSGYLLSVTVRQMSNPEINLNRIFALMKAIYELACQIHDDRQNDRQNIMQVFKKDRQLLLQKYASLFDAFEDQQEATTKLTRGSASAGGGGSDYRMSLFDINAKLLKCIAECPLGVAEWIQLTDKIESFWRDRRDELICRMIEGLP